jgi:nitroreductase
MELYETIQKRMTIRDFSDKPIADETMQKIISASLLAPSNNHMRDWHFVFLNDRSKREEIILQTMKPITRKGAIGVVNRWQMTDPIQREMYIDAIPKQISMLLNCACLVIPCYRQEPNILKPKSLSDLNGFASIWLAIENLLLAAAAEGIFGVTRIPFETERQKVKVFCQIPAGYDIPCLLALGYPAQDAKRPVQVQVNPVERIHRDTW